MVKRNPLVVLALMLVLLGSAGGILAAQADPYALLGRLILPGGDTVQVRKEVHTALKELGQAALPALIEATYYGQVQSWSPPLMLPVGKTLVITYRARVAAVPALGKVSTSVAGAVADGALLDVKKEVVEIRRGEQLVREPVRPDDLITFKLIVQNTTQKEATTITVVDVLFVGLTYVPGTTKATWPDGSSTADPKLRDAGWIRWDAVNVLGDLAYADPQIARPAIPALVDRALTDIDPHPRWRSLWALSTFRTQIVNEEVVPRLRVGLDSGDPRIVWNTAVALAFFGQAEAAPLLNQGLDAADAMQRWEAVYCLGMVHNEESVPLVMAVLTDVERREARLRQEAANTLGKIGDVRAIPALVAALQDPEAGVRWRAAAALARLGDPSVIPALKAALAREQDEFAIDQIKKAIETLEKTGGK